MKNLFTLFALTLLFAGTSYAQTNDAHNVTVNTNAFVDIDVDNDIEFTFDYVTQSVSTGPGTATVTNNVVTIDDIDGSAQLFYATNSSTNYKITAVRTAETGFDLDEVRLRALTPVAGGSKIGSEGLAQPEASLTTSAFDLITGINQASATADLDYDIDFSMFSEGSSSFTTTFTITP